VIIDGSDHDDRNDDHSDQTDAGSFWQNQQTGLGAGKDRTSWHLPSSVEPLALQTLAALWIQDPIAGCVVDAIVDDGLRGGFQIVYNGDSEIDQGLKSAVQAAATDLELEMVVRQAAKAARGLGGGGVFLLANQGLLAAEEPLVEDHVTSIERLLVVDRRDLIVTDWKFDQHEVYTYTPSRIGLSPSGGGTRLHASHIIDFPGVDTTLRDRWQFFDGWRQSILQSVWETIRDFRQSWQSTVAMIQNGSQGVLKIPRLWETMAKQGRRVLEKTLSTIQLYSWVSRIMPISSDEEFKWVDRTYTGVAELLREHQPLIAQAAEMPITRLFGISPGGLSATGVSDERNWLSQVGSWRRLHITDPTERLVRLIAKVTGAPDWRNWGIQWSELEVLTATDRGELEKTMAQADALRIAAGMPASVIMLHRFGGVEYDASPPRLTEAAYEALTSQLNLELQGLLQGAPLHRGLPAGSSRDNEPELDIE
jgi:phage-related protein (TIGR01555 family)